MIQQYFLPDQANTLELKSGDYFLFNKFLKNASDWKWEC